MDITHSSRLTVRPADPGIVSANDGVLTAVASGTTHVDVTYGLMTIVLAVTVP
jgi:hypothetical protein